MRKCGQNGGAEGAAPPDPLVRQDVAEDGAQRLVDAHQRRDTQHLHLAEPRRIQIVEGRSRRQGEQRPRFFA